MDSIRLSSALCFGVIVNPPRYCAPEDRNFLQRPLAIRLKRNQRGRLFRLADRSRFVLRTRNPVLWLINAAGLLGQRIASQGIGPRPRTATDLLVFAGPALALQLAGVAQ